MKSDTGYWDYCGSGLSRVHYFNLLLQTVRQLPPDKQAWYVPMLSCGEERIIPLWSLWGSKKGQPETSLRGESERRGINDRVTQTGYQEHCPNSLG